MATVDMDEPMRRSGYAASYDTLYQVETHREPGQTTYQKESQQQQSVQHS